MRGCWKYEITWIFFLIKIQSWSLLQLVRACHEMVYERISIAQSNELGSVSATHQRSNSIPGKVECEEDDWVFHPEASPRSKDMGNASDSVNRKKAVLSSADIQNSLRSEILQLEKRLQDQVAVRCTLEKALGYKTSSCKLQHDVSMPQPATELIKEISVLEVEVTHLEQYLLSLYRKAFDQQLSSISPSKAHDKVQSPLTAPRPRRLEFSQSDVTSDRANVTGHPEDQFACDPLKDTTSAEEENVLDSSVKRCHSSLSERSASFNKASPPMEPLGKALRACHSQPLSMQQYVENASTVISLAEHLGTRISDHVSETPNKLSEDMIKCMATIYSKLSSPPPTHNGLASPLSSLSSMSTFSPKDQCGVWSPGLRNDSSFDTRLDNPFHIEGLKEFSGPYSMMVEVQCIYRDNQKLGDIEQHLQYFRSLISQLEEVDPGKLTNEEKLAFWINVHNALVMHAFLAYGIPQNNIRRVFLLLKAAYNIGGHVVSADMIQNLILGCRLSRPGQWLRLLLSSRTKFKSGDGREAYAIKFPAPLLHFALSCGNHSDPAVRLYTPKRIMQELETAKDEYIRATFGIRKDQKIILPKIVECFAKDSGLCHAGVMEAIQQSLPESVIRSIKKSSIGKSRKSIEWVPHNFAFRYIIMKELVS